MRNLAIISLLLIALLSFSNLFAQTEPLPLPTVQSKLSGNKASNTPMVDILPLTLLAPENDAKNVTQLPVFSWTVLPQATDYILIVKHKVKTKLKASFDATAICVDQICTVDLASLPDVKKFKLDRTYKWRIKAIIPSISHKTEWQKFTVAANALQPRATATNCGFLGCPTNTPKPTTTPTKTNTPTSTPHPYCTTEARTERYDWQSNLWDDSYGTVGGSVITSGSDGILLLNLTRPHYVFKIEIQLEGSPPWPLVAKDIILTAGSYSGTQPYGTIESPSIYQLSSATIMSEIYLDGTPNPLQDPWIPGLYHQEIKVKYLTIHFCADSFPTVPTTGPGCISADVAETYLYNDSGWSGGTTGGIHPFNWRKGESMTLNLRGQRYIRKLVISWLHTYTGPGMKYNAGAGGTIITMGDYSFTADLWPVQWVEGKVYDLPTSSHTIPATQIDFTGIVNPEAPNIKEVVIRSITVYHCAVPPTATPTNTPDACTSLSSLTSKDSLVSRNCVTASPSPTSPTSVPNNTCMAEVASEGAPPPDVFVRETPGGNIITTLANGTPIEVLGRFTTVDIIWYRIRYNNNSYGWMRHIVVKFPQPSTSTPTPDKCSNIPEMNSSGQTATPTATPLPTLTITPSATWDPSVTKTPTPNTQEEATRFNNHGHVIGLPVPITRFPYTASYDTNTYGYWDGENSAPQMLPVHGFGQTAFAFRYKDEYYENTSGIHTGLDFGKELVWVNETVLSICDGLVVPSRNGGAFGGTIARGTGVSVRCFLAPLSYLNSSDQAQRQKIDPDNNGNPNLSDIVVIYNHLEGPQATGTVLVEMYQIVYAGDALGKTGTTPTNSYDHLHLEVFLMRGYYRDNNMGDPGIMVNPLFIFGNQEAGVFENWIDANYNYHPIEYGTGGIPFPTDNPNHLGIAISQLNKWSTGANNADTMAKFNNTPTPSGNFWTAQIPSPFATVEWPVSMIVRTKNQHPTAQKEIVAYVFSLFINDPYHAPDCAIVSASAYNYANCPYDQTR